MHLLRVDRQVALHSAPIADRGVSIGSERSDSRLSQEPRLVQRLRARMLNPLWSRKVVAWDGADREDAQIAAALVFRACLRGRISESRPQPLIHHADNGHAIHAIRAATP